MLVDVLQCFPPIYLKLQWQNKFDSSDMENYGKFYRFSAINVKIVERPC